MSGGDCGCGCGGAGGCGYGGAGSYGTAQLPWGALGANPLIFPGETQVPINYTTPLAPGPQLSFAPTTSALYATNVAKATAASSGSGASSGPGTGTVVLAVAAVAAIGLTAWWAYKNSYSQRTAAARSERAQTSYRPRARRPSRRASRVNSRNNGALRQLSPARR
jgi:hypothetical protein